MVSLTSQPPDPAPTGEAADPTVDPIIGDDAGRSDVGDNGSTADSGSAGRSAADDRALRAADPGNPTRRDVSPAGNVFAVMAAALALATLLNAETLLGSAEAAELGPRRDVALAVWQPVERVASVLGLTLPRRGLDGLRQADQTGIAGTRTVATTDDEQPEPDPVDNPDVDPSVALGSAVDLPPAAPATSSPATDEAPTEEAPTDQAPTGAGPPGQAEDEAQPPGSAPGEAGPAETAAPGSQPAAPGLPETTPPPPSTTPETTVAPSPEPLTPPPPDAGFALRRPTADDPLRILIIGDSTLDAVGTSVLRDLAGTGVTHGVLDYRVSSGLSRPDFFDWPGHLRQLRPQLDPEIVMIMVGANDAQPFVVGPDVESFGTDVWFETYRARVLGLLDELTAEGDWVVWIGQPVMRRDDFDSRMQQLNQVYAEAVAHYPTAVYVDTRATMSDADGGYAAYLPDANGNRTQVRQTDGVHLTSDGGDHLSPTIIAAINEIAPLF